MMNGLPVLLLAFLFHFPYSLSCLAIRVQLLGRRDIVQLKLVDLQARGDLNNTKKARHRNNMKNYYIFNLGFCISTVLIGSLNLGLSAHIP